MTIDREIDNGRSNIRKKDIPNEEEEWGGGRFGIDLKRVVEITRSVLLVWSKMRGWAGHQPPSLKYLHERTKSTVSFYWTRTRMSNRKGMCVCESYGYGPSV